MTNTNIDSRIPPQDDAAERACLGSMFLGATSEVLDVVEADDFYSQTHRTIFDALLYLSTKECEIDLLLFHNEVKRRGKLEEVGGIDYLTDLANAVPSPANAESYAKIVRDKSRLRHVIQVTQRSLDAAYASQANADDVFGELQTAILNSASCDDSHALKICEIAPGVAETLSSTEHRHSGVPTGFDELDEMLGGLHAGEMIVIAGRPSMGKTALGLNIGEHVAEHSGGVVGLFSLEMGREALIERLLLKRSGLDSVQLRSGYLTPEDRERLRQAGDSFQDVQLLIDDSAGITSQQIRARAQNWQQQHDLRLVLIDYLQLIRPTDKRRSRYEETTDISGQMKTLARLLNIPVIVLAQLNRQTEGREGNRPRLSDLRDSGAIEQDADVVILLHRDDYYNRDRAGYKATHEADLVIAKQRNGPTGTIQLSWNGGCMSFANKAEVPS